MCIRDSLCRYQVANGYMGRVGLSNAGGEAHGESDLHEAVVTAVVNKRAGGMWLISGRKAFQKPMKDGVQLLNTIQDVYCLLYTSVQPLYLLRSRMVATPGRPDKGMRECHSIF